jgi:hypothetical protein
MPRFWMTYESPNRLAGVIIVDSASLIGACMRVAIEGIDREAEFAEGHEIDHATAAMIPTAARGRLLAPEEAAKLLLQLERKIRKRPRAASVRRRAADRKRA